MENILPGFHKHHHSDDRDEYNRRVHPRPGYGPGYGPGYEYTGQPAGFEHLGSPPKQRLEDMDAKTIAQLGYEGPEGERRKVLAINGQLSEREYEREGYPNGVPIDGYQYREGYSDGYRHDHQRSKHGLHAPHIGGSRRDEDEYRRGRHGGDRYGSSHGRSGYVVPVPVTVDRKFEEDGTVVENVYPDNSVSAVYSRPDHGRIHYGRQDSFPETALQEAAAYHHGRYPAGYSHERRPPPGYAPPYSDATSSYSRRPYEGEDFVEDRHRRY